MDTKILNKIDAEDKTVKDILHKQKYTVDYFQREYHWERKHIEQLLTDFEAAFAKNYNNSHARSEVENYNSYYLGPIVLCEQDGTSLIIDGQQRLTSLTLLLIYIKNLQKDWENSEQVESLIRSSKFGKYSYNLQIEDRKECLNGLCIPLKSAGDSDSNWHPPSERKRSFINLKKKRLFIASYIISRHLFPHLRHILHNHPGVRIKDYPFVIGLIHNVPFDGIGNIAGDMQQRVDNCLLGAPELYSLF